MIFITLLSSKTKKLKKKKKKFELESKKKKIVTENLEKKKNCNRASPPRNTLRKIPEVTTDFIHENVLVACIGILLPGEREGEGFIKVFTISKLELVHGWHIWETTKFFFHMFFVKLK